MPFAVAIHVYKIPRLFIEDLEDFGFSGEHGRRYLMRKAGPIIKECLNEMTHETESVVQRLYETEVLPIPGISLPMHFTGAYGRSVRRIYRAQTAHVWPYAYVGLYPAPSSDNPISRNRQIYIPSVEFGSQGPGGKPGSEMLERLRNYVGLKFNILPGTKYLVTDPETGRTRSRDANRAIAWNLALKLLSGGTYPRQVMFRATSDPELQQAWERWKKMIAGSLADIIVALEEA